MVGRAMRRHYGGFTCKLQTCREDSVLRVLLVQPPGKKRFVTPPMGLLYLARMLLPQHDIQIIDLNAAWRSRKGVPKDSTELIPTLDGELRRVEWREICQFWLGWGP